MTNNFNKELLDLLACPDCESDLKPQSSELKCTQCHQIFEIREGIPCLFPATVDKAHLHEEESLAEMMQHDPHNKKETLSREQWKLSKIDFWGMVMQNVSGSNKKFINIGCGFDTHFKKIEEAGHTFVNFDLIYKMLQSLQEKQNAKSCIAGDINKMPFKKGAFDYVISIDVIHHESEHLDDLLDTFASLLKPGGILFLEDPNAWGMFQLIKSIFMPRWLYRFLRSMYHKLKKSTHHPADYEFPTNVWKVKKMLKDRGFEQIHVYPQNAYPTVGGLAFKVYQMFSWAGFVKTYMNYHYMLSAAKKS